MFLLTLQGTSESSLFKLVIPAIGPLVTDRSPAVRERVFASLAQWLKIYR
jgi:hypothetical protein